MKNFRNILLSASLTVALFAACSGNGGLTVSGLDPAKFDSTVNEKPVKLYTLKNSKGMEVCITNFGGRIVSLCVPDKTGKPTDVVLGCDNLKEYTDTINSPSDFGASIGRYANRINKGQLTIEGKKIQLPINNFGHCLHGGPSGWQYQVYDANQLNDSTLQLTMNSKDGDNNFPGNVKAIVTYTVKSNNSLDIKYEATTDKETVINMTNHSYFNLTGDLTKPGMDMVLYINADKYTPTDATFMTTGEILPVKGTLMDFTKPHAISKTIGDSTFIQIKNARGYDHNWCLNTYKDGKGNDAVVAASLYAPNTGIYLEMFTTEPGVQVYTGNFLEGKITGKHGIAYPKQCSVCLESQKYPDSPNKKNWPSPYLKPGQKYESHTVFKFSVK
ncbi:MAG: galactose mutarotase [Prevotella sp.]|jgi:aldose 1-epimerase|nr:galactose mutarotase [Prevotella sp.]MCI1281008.1 galactose mutarotase [Prevotella sp.]